MNNDNARRTELVELAQGIRDTAILPPGFNVAVVVTDQNGDWVGVSSTADDSYTAQLLRSALEGADLRSHAPAEPNGNPCLKPTRDQLRATRVARAQALKEAIDAEAAPAVLSGLATVLLFTMANDVPDDAPECQPAPQYPSYCKVTGCVFPCGCASCDVLSAPKKPERET